MISINGGPQPMTFNEVALHRGWQTRYWQSQDDRVCVEVCWNKKSGYCNSDLVDLTSSEVAATASFHHPAVRVIEIGEMHVVLDLGTVFDQIRDVAQPPTPKRSIHAKWRFDPAPDLTVLHSDDVDSEISNLITAEINSEIIRKISK